jgi:hypothetical protein
MPLLVYHGVQDSTLSIKEGRFIVNRVKKYNNKIKFIELEQGTHYITKEALLNKESAHFIRTSRRKEDAPSPVASLIKTGDSIKDLFLEPFIFVDCDYDYKQQKHSKLFLINVNAWNRYSKATPRVVTERELTPEQKKKYHLFLFGTPESSTLISDVLKKSYIKVNSDTIVIDKKSVKRKHIGIFARTKSPFNKDKCVVLNWGVPWGRFSGENHIYDSLPGYIIYKNEPELNDPDRGNKAIVAGFYKEKKR